MRNVWVNFKSKGIVILRGKLLDLLGGVCCECGYKENKGNLDLDHKFNDGKIDRRKFRNNNYAMYKYYLDNPKEAKERLQVLCRNCNWNKNIKYQYKVRQRKEKRLQCVVCGGTAIYEVEFGCGLNQGLVRLLCGAHFNLEREPIEHEIKSLIYLEQGIDDYSKLFHDEFDY